MKTFFITFLIILSQVATAKINDFNSLINEHSKVQNELHKSISTLTAVPIESSSVEQSKKSEVIVLDTNREVYPEESAPAKNNKKTTPKKKLTKSDDIEEKHFLRLGEELDNAQ